MDERPATERQASKAAGSRSNRLGSQMPLYTFYPCKSDGASETFVCFELADDAHAYVRALHVLNQHQEATHVVVWAGERKVHIRTRGQEPPGRPGPGISRDQPDT